MTKEIEVGTVLGSIDSNCITIGYPGLTIVSPTLTYHLLIGRIKIDTVTGEITIPEDMSLSDASREIWEGLSAYHNSRFPDAS